MNQKQREYLIKQIEEQGKLALDELEKRRPVPPSLNNYLIAASLSGKLQIREADNLASLSIINAKLTADQKLLEGK